VQSITLIRPYVKSLAANQATTDAESRLRVAERPHPQCVTYYGGNVKASVPDWSGVDSKVGRVCNLMTTSQISASSNVIADINYIRNPPPSGAEVLQFVTEDESLSTMDTLPGRAMPVTNARPLRTDLDREGFLLIRHVSTVDDFDQIQEDPNVDQCYTEEMAALLGQMTGAAKVFMLGGGKKRYGESATDKLTPLFNAKPARYPHADNTDSSSLELVEMVAAFVDDIDLSSYSHWALYNMWRAVSPPPQDFPLAVCDARTVSPIDEVTICALTKERSGEIRHDTTGYLFNRSHAWHYYPDMTRDEVLVFKAHDTDSQRSQRVPHTAFTDPTCPTDIPTRASVEMRGLALFA
jgi:hypothetical protein